VKVRTFLNHSFFWGAIYLLWVLIFRSYSVSVGKTMTVEFCYLIFITVDYYTVSNFVLPHSLMKGKYFLFIAAVLLIVAFSAWLRALVAVQMNLHFFHPTQSIDFVSLYFRSVFNIGIWVLIITMAKMIIEHKQTQHQFDLLEKEREKTELDYLKAQINPHVIFNSLNTVYGKIEKTNQEARNILLQFSELLRYQLYDCGADKIDLEKEIEYIKNYIAFQRLRKNEKLVVNLDIHQNQKGLKIAPLLFGVLIENAFKFVSNFSDRENRIEISICSKGNSLHGTFINTIETQTSPSPTRSNGIGILNLKRRLELLYAQKYELRSFTRPDHYEAILIIDLQ
jgi:two-component system LytT family sensor kinase